MAWHLILWVLLALFLSPAFFVLMAALRTDGSLVSSDLIPSQISLINFQNLLTQTAFLTWMKNTLIPLDILWIDQGRRVVHARHDVPPCQADPCPSYDPGVAAKYVLEVAAGVARQHGVTHGSQLQFEGLDNVTVD